MAHVIKDPLRVQILAVANQRAISPSEFAAESGRPLSTVAYHFRVLAENDFLEETEKIQVRGATKHMYRGSRRGLIPDADWAQLGEAIQAGISAAVLQDFNARVAQAMAAGTFDARDDSVFLWVALVLDEVSWPKYIEILRWAHSEVMELEVETVERRAKGEGGAPIPATFSIAGFESPKEAQPEAGKEQKP